MRNIPFIDLPGWFFFFLGIITKSVKLVWKKISGGAVVNFVASMTYHIKELLISLAPQQDLHGYDSPWPGGGGTNMFDASAVTSDNYYINSSTGAVGVPSAGAGEWRNSAYTPVTPGDVLYFGEVNSSASVAGTAFYSDTVVSSYISGFSATQLANADNVWTVPEGTAYMRHSFRVDDGYNENWETTVYIVKNTDTHEWTPYANICPITGHSGVTVYNDPAYGGTIEWNQICPSTYKSGSLSWESDSGTYYKNFNSRDIESTVMPITSGHKYIVCANITRNISENDGFNFILSPNSGNNLSIIVDNGAENGLHGVIAEASANSYIKTIRANNYAFKRGFNTGDSISYDNLILCDLTAMFGAGNEPASVEAFKALFPEDYYAYNAEEHTCVSAVNGDPYVKVEIAFPTPPGTVYDGTIEAVEGVLTNNSLEAEFDGSEDESWVKRTGVNAYFGIKLGDIGHGVDEEVKCDTFKRVRITANSNNIGVDVVNSSTYTGFFLNVRPKNAAELADATAFKTWLSNHPIQVVYKLAVPETYQVNKQHINALEGENNIWVEDGEIIEVTFRK